MPRLTDCDRTSSVISRDVFWPNGLFKLYNAIYVFYLIYVTGINYESIDNRWNAQSSCRQNNHNLNNVMETGI